VTSLKPVVILLVEDELGDQKLITQSLSSQKISNQIQIVESGEEALEYLSHCKISEKEWPRPDLILLDLCMAGMGGKEFLKIIKSDPDLDTIPVVILTTSDSEEDIHDSYKLGAAGYVKKPVLLEDFQRVMADLHEYWFVMCKRICESGV
jgi:CheY-like chemotaxis protein